MYYESDISHCVRFWQAMVRKHKIDLMPLLPLPKPAKDITAKRFTEEAKIQAVARIEAGENIRAIARSIGCTHSTIRAWRDGLYRNSKQKIYNPE